MLLYQNITRLNEVVTMKMRAYFLAACIAVTSMGCGKKKDEASANLSMNMKAISTGSSLTLDGGARVTMADEVDSNNPNAVLPHGFMSFTPTSILVPFKTID